MLVDKMVADETMKRLSFLPNDLILSNALKQRFRRKSQIILHSYHFHSKVKLSPQLFLFNWKVVFCLSFDLEQKFDKLKTLEKISKQFFSIPEGLFGAKTQDLSKNNNICSNGLLSKNIHYNIS